MASSPAAPSAPVSLTEWGLDGVSDRRSARGPLLQAGRTLVAVLLGASAAAGVYAFPDRHIAAAAPVSSCRQLPFGHRSPAVRCFTAPHLRGPSAITAGPDGALWFTAVGTSAYRDDAAPAIGRISTTGVIRLFPQPGARLGSITAGPDGALWFTEGNAIGRITTDGRVRIFRGRGIRSAVDIVSGPDGALWITDSGSIVRMTIDSRIRRFRADEPRWIAAGTDALWFTDGARVRRLSVEGTMRTFALRGMDALADVTVARDGAVWFTNSEKGPRDALGEVTRQGKLRMFPTGAGNPPAGLAMSRSGVIWFTLPLSGCLGYVEPARAASGTVCDPTMMAPEAITAAPDGGMWFTNREGDSIGRLAPARS